MKTNLEYPTAWDDGTLETRYTFPPERGTQKSKLTQDVFVHFMNMSLSLHLNFFSFGETTDADS